MAAAFEPSALSLLLWGGVDSDDEPVLEPAFVVDAPASMPRLDGPYRITGENLDGRTLFSLSFGMPEIADARGKAFAFILPVRRAWHGDLNRITFSGPEGVATLGGEDERVRPGRPLRGAPPWTRLPARCGACYAAGPNRDRHCRPRGGRCRSPDWRS